MNIAGPISPATGCPPAEHSGGGLWRLALPALPLGLLWFRLIDHLRIEWAVNPQYSYGWAVPFLCAYLWWRGKETTKAEGRQKPLTPSLRHSITPASSCSATRAPRDPLLAFGIYAFAFLSLALLYLPTRLVQEANPEWRFVSWALALIVVGLTAVIWKTGAAVQQMKDVRPKMGRTKSPDFRLPSSLFHFRLFPLLFFLVAIPWPTLIEGPVIQALTRVNAAMTVELLNAFGHPALRRGNTIEVGSGVVGIDEACSGIRSFQAALMISLFFGELYRLAAFRRVLCVLAGFALAFLFNVGRTTLLTCLAAKRGIPAIAHWHDPAGVAILVACFVCLWLIAKNASRPAKEGRNRGSGIPAPRCADSDHETREMETAKTSQGETKDNSGTPPLHYSNDSPPLPLQYSITRVAQNPTNPALRSLRLVPVLSVSIYPLSCLLLAWLLLVEAGTELWYRSGESRLARTFPWRIELPRSNPTFQWLPFSEKTRQFLRYDEALNGAWEETDGTRWQAIFLRWNPGRVAVHLAKGHTPEVCLTAAGRVILSRSELKITPVPGIELPFHSYLLRGQRGLVHVYYCLWQDRTDAQDFATTKLTYGNRLGPVLAGRRNGGQRSIELAVWGIDDPAQAEAAARRQFGKIWKRENAENTK